MYTKTKQSDRCRRLWIAVWMLALAGWASAQQAKTITGSVADAKGEPLMGVNVVLKESRGQGTTTDLDGRFTLNVPGEKSVLIFTYIGFSPKEVLVGNQSQLKVVLQEDVAALDEVVVVAYGSQRKQTVTGAVSMLKSSELLEVPVANVSNALTGRLPGVTTMQASGRPGSDAAEIYIRGQSSWQSTSPLIIIDGIEQESFSQLDPNEIETLSVLKDASSTAVYGIRGANGVVLITTKRGAEGKPQISLSANWGFQQPTSTPKFLGSYDHLLLRKMAWENDGKDPLQQEPNLFSPEAMEGYRTGSDPYRYPNVNWYDEILGNTLSPQQQYNVNVSGGTKVVKYFVSLGYLDQQGMFNHQNRQTEYNPSSYFRRFNFRSNVDLTVNKWQTVSMNLSGRSEEQNGIAGVGGAVGGTGGFYQGLIAREPWRMPVFNPDGSLSATISQGNPIASVAHSGYVNSRVNYFDVIGTLRNDLSFLTEGLTFDLSISYNNRFGATNTYSDGIDAYYYNAVNDSYEQMSEKTPFKFVKTENYRPISRTQFQAKLGYRKQFKQNKINAIMVYNQQMSTDGDKIPSALMGYAARLEYGYADKYLAEVSLGYNGSENFAPGYRFGLFPSGSLGYVISEEKFMSGARKIIPYLKVRASIGLVGNDMSKEARFLYQGAYSTVGIYQGGGTPNFGFGTTNPSTNGGIKEDRNENRFLTWETSLKQDIGIDGRFFGGNLLAYSVDFFREHRENILMQGRSTPQLVGISSPYLNIGEVQNWGWEGEVSHRNTIGKVEYFIRGTYSFARNKILNYDDPGKMPDYQKTEGYRIGQFRGYEVLGYFQSFDEIAASPTQSTLEGRIVPGDLKYRDVDEDGSITSKDKVAIGYSRIPEITYSISPGFSWNGIDVSVMFQGAANASVIFTGNAGFEFAGGSGGGQVTQMHQNYWTLENQHTNPYPSLHHGNHSNKQVNSYHLRSGEYIRLKNAQVGYTFPKGLIRKAGMTGLRVYVSSNNIFTWSKVDNYDPEMINESGDVYPQQRLVSFGINVNF